MELLPPVKEHDDHEDLHDDVRWLAHTLGTVIRRLEGSEAFEAVEELRKACRARRLGEPGAERLEQIRSRVDGFSLKTARVAARAFTLFFLLINTAEQVQRVRARRTTEQKGPPSEETASLHWTLENLKENGYGADQVVHALSNLDIRPVLTAHPDRKSVV